jgi:hypothetical protein
MWKPSTKLRLEQYGGSREQEAVAKCRFSHTSVSATGSLSVAIFRDRSLKVIPV